MYYVLLDSNRKTGLQLVLCEQEKGGRGFKSQLFTGSGSRKPAIINKSISLININLMWDPDSYVLRGTPVSSHSCESVFLDELNSIWEVP